MKNYLLVLFLSVTFKTIAQSPVDIQQQKMKDLLSLAGSWSGSGWMILPDAKKHTFNQTEVVTAKLDGGLLIVEGNGKDSETGKPIHTAIGILTYDNAKQNYRWTAIASGFVTDLTPIVQKDGFIWSLTTRMGVIRYTIKFTTDEWTEIGELSTDNEKTWTQNFEMHLKRS